jgi:dTDP-glucose pyrophosphorylase
MNSTLSNADWRKSLISEDASLGDVVRNLNDSRLQIAMVVTAEDVLVGTITDGDIRRALLNGLSLNSEIGEIIHRNPLVAPLQIGRETVLSLMSANKLHKIPAVDNEGRVLGLHSWAEWINPGRRSNLMVIMAGGKGQRLRPFTETCPKPLLPVGGKPMLEHIIERAKGEGFYRFVLSVHYLGNMIEDYFGDGSKWQVQIEYIKEDSPMGTAGAISLLNPFPDLPFLVTNGDVLSDIRYGEMLDFHLRHQAVATMAVRQHEWQHPFGVVHTKGVDFVGIEEKPVSRSHINAGIYVLDPLVLQVLEVGESCDMPTLFGRLHGRASTVVVYPMHEPWLDIGRPDDYSYAQARLAQKEL